MHFPFDPAPLDPPLEHPPLEHPPLRPRASRGLHGMLVRPGRSRISRAAYTPFAFRNLLGDRCQLRAHPKLAPAFFDHFRFEVARRFCRYLRSADDVVLFYAPAGGRRARVGDGQALERCISHFYREGDARCVELVAGLADGVVVREAAGGGARGGGRAGQGMPAMGAAAFAGRAGGHRAGEAREEKMRQRGEGRRGAEGGHGRAAAGAKEGLDGDEASNGCMA